MTEVTYKVTVRKTVQVREYEPTVIELSTEGTCPENLRVQSYDKAFKEIKVKMNELFGEKPAALPPGNCLL
jgi:hypothetical protein